MFAPPLKIEFLFTPGCPAAWPALRLLRRVLAEEQCEARVIVRAIVIHEAAIRVRFHGSPTIRVDGVDIEGPSIEREGYALRCRTYHPHGGQPGVPHPDTIRRALHTHPGKRHPRPQERPRRSTT